MADISVSTVRSCLGDFVSDISEIKTLFDNIQEKYIDECGANCWNTPKAHEYMTTVSTSFNDYISQFNNYFQAGYSEFVKDANTFFKSQGAAEVQEEDIEVISDLSVTWAAEEEEFKVPDPGQVESLTNNYLVKYVNDVVNLLNNMCSLIDTAVSAGMNDEFCCDDKKNIESLTNSAQDVINEYSGSAAEAAVTADENVQVFRS